MTLVARNATIDKALQDGLDAAWEIVDRTGDSVADVAKWLRKGGHKSISDWVAEEVAPYLERGERKIS